EGLDFSGLAQFKASDLLVDAAPTSERGKPMQVPLDLIDFDPAQPRRSIDPASIDELAVSFAMHGVLEPVSLRTRPEFAGRFIVNRGERRVRAARKAGLTGVPAFLDERVDPYAQAVENLHRENMTPFDLATFIAEREKEGQSRAEIGRRLNKPRSFITEAACLIGAPAEIRQAYDAGRLGSGTRLLYRLAVAMEKQPALVTALLAGDAVITRAAVEPLLAANAGTGHSRQPATNAPTTKAGAAPSAGRTVLVVEHAGRRGSLRLKAHDDDVAEVRFGDGTRDLVELKELRLVCWATEE
ncbi:MAG: ParB/RepB/Spo0J family partition protein, partial [Variovorax sp.]|nr:ParB/RepB/Spo0J family partition protein [Variovorax sp.]